VPLLVVLLLPLPWPLSPSLISCLTSVTVPLLFAANNLSTAAAFACAAALGYLLPAALAVPLLSQQGLRAAVVPASKGTTTVLSNLQQSRDICIEYLAAY